MVICFDGDIRYTETRYKSTTDISFPHTNQSEQIGKEFHLILGRKIQSLSDVLYEVIYTEYVREHLKTLYVQTGKSYDIWVNAYYEA